MPTGKTVKITTNTAKKYDILTVAGLTQRHIGISDCHRHKKKAQPVMIGLLALLFRVKRKLLFLLWLYILGHQLRLV
ncbi:hypothetical protein C7N43_03030 [Sphingobacteriales bacterium UPWRP_1]|nr:hypothetical protein C7N43_03030 [Sphingobacteriales bacterium UPWRP_1]